MPCLAVLSTFSLCASIPPYIWIYFVGFEAIGLAFYFAYGVKHSLVNQQFRERQMQKDDNDFFGLPSGEIELK